MIVVIYPWQEVQYLQLLFDSGPFLGTSLKVMSNYTNHIAETPLDDAFAPNVWTPAKEQAA